MQVSYIKPKDKRFGLRIRHQMIIALLSLPFFIQAQSLTDAVRFTNQQISGTARTAGVAGSFGAMGGDFGSININPAGLGDFYKSQFNFGFSMDAINNESFLVNDRGNAQDVNDLNLNINHLGYIATLRPPTGLFSSNIIIGLSQTNNFTEEFSYSGKTKGSITERFAEVANGLGLDELDGFEAGPAFDSGAIFDKNDDLFYETDFFDTISLVNKNQYIDRAGKMNELAIAWAGNFDNKFNFGVSVAMPFLSFEEYKEYNETDLEDELPVFTNLTYKEDLSISGMGFNFKVGATTKLAKILRLGLAYHSPNWLTLTDDYSTDISYTYDENGQQTYEAESPEGNFKYKLITPSKVIASAGVLLDFGDVKGFVNGDVILQNYAKANFDFTSFGTPFFEYEEEVNNDIEGELQNTTSFRVGAEFAYKKLRVRGGVNAQASPYQIDEGSILQQTLSFGLGYRGESFYIDGTFYALSDTEGYYPYLVLTDGRNQLVNKERNTSKAMMSVGFMF